MNSVMIITISVICSVVAVFGIQFMTSGINSENAIDKPTSVSDRAITTNEITSKKFSKESNPIGNNMIPENEYSQINPAEKIKELKKLFKDCSEFNFKELPMMEVLKFSDEKQYEYHKTKADMLSAKIDCNQYNHEIAGEISHQESLLEQKWINSP